MAACGTWRSEEVELLATNPSPLLMTRRRLLFCGGALGALLLAGCSRAADHGSKHTERSGGGVAPAAPLASMVVHKDANCGCCQSWADIAERAGYAVQVVNEADMSAVKARLGVPESLASCHTTHVNGLVVEGHVPLQALERILRERPEGLQGIAVPGMPAGSPGMELPDGTLQSYQVIAFFRDGRTSVVPSA